MNLLRAIFLHGYRVRVEEARRGSVARFTRGNVAAQMGKVVSRKKLDKMSKESDRHVRKLAASIR